MVVGVADTHTALWHLFDDKRLSVAAEASINSGEGKTQDCYFGHKLGRGGLFGREEPSTSIGL
jgi:hypothetical protein